MKDNRQIFEIAAILALAAILIYKKYFAAKRGDVGRKSADAAHKSDNEDDYEPYSGKNKQE